MISTPAARSAADDIAVAGEHAPFPFIVGVPRSGTTLLRLMLDSHPDLAIPSESHFFQELARAGTDTLSRDGLYELIVRSFTWRGFQLGQAELKDQLNRLEPFSAAAGVRLLYRLYAQRFAKGRWGDKTPDYGHVIPQISALLPEAHFIHVIRDGRDVALSRRDLWFGSGSDIAAQAEHWAHWIRHTRKLAERSSNYLEVRYEELVAQPRDVLAKVCAFIQLPFSDNMMDYHMSADRRLAEIPDWDSQNVTAVQLRDIQELTKQPPQIERIGRWKREMLQTEIDVFEDVAGALLHELGYELAGISRDVASLCPGVRRSATAGRVSALLLTDHIPEKMMPSFTRLKGMVDEFVIMVDRQRADEATRARANELATRQEEFAPDGVAEVHLARGVAACAGDWILRLDSDEELSSEWLDGQWRDLLTFKDITHFAFPRRWLTSADRYLRVAPWAPDHQVRLFRNDPAGIEFGTTLHGPIAIRGRKGFTRNLAINHHVLTLSSRPQREAKVRFYETQPGPALAHYYLFEDYNLPSTEIPNGRFDIARELPRMGLLFDSEFERIVLKTSRVPEEVTAEQLFWPVVEVTNENRRSISSYPPFPVNLSYHWLERSSRRCVVQDGERTPLYPDVPAGATVSLHLFVQAPAEPGEYLLQVTLVQEAVRWFEQQNPGLVEEFPVRVRQRIASGR